MSATTNPAFRMLPPLEVDYATGKTLPEKLGRSEAPVTVLPRVIVEFEQSARPALQLTLQLRPEIAPASAALEVMKFVQALDWYERGLGGHGIVWDKAHSHATPDQGVVRLILTAGSFTGAAERFERLKDAINGTTDPHIVTPKSLLTTEGIFVSREAVLLSTVA